MAAKSLWGKIGDALIKLMGDFRECIRTTIRALVTFEKEEIDIKIETNEPIADILDAILTPAMEQDSNKDEKQMIQEKLLKVREKHELLNRALIDAKKRKQKWILNLPIPCAKE